MSNKKPFEYIEDKIKLAAENNLPAFDEKAWDAMTVKLDKEERKRRPFFLWWIVLPLVLAVAWGGYVLLKPADLSKQPAPATAAISKQNKSADNMVPAITTGETPVSEKNTTRPVAENATVANTESSVKATVDKMISTTQPGPKPAFPATLNRKKNISGKNKGRMIAHTSGNAADETVTAPYSEVEKDTEIAEKPAPVDSKTSPGVPVITTLDKKATDKNAPVNTTVVAVESNTDKIKQDKNDSTKAGPEQKATASASKKKDKKKSAGFYLLAAGGIDAGSTKLFSLSSSTITPKYGIGIGYQLNQKLSVQTGFYATNKKYIAGPDDYHAKAGSYWSEVQMQQVKAACLVYEIPITVRYNFIQRPSVTWYGSVGTASYIMKKEDYDYFYISYNMPHEKKWQYTGNEHFLSTLIFSAGIEKKLSGKLSLLVEPSFSIPITGVGDGKVKLFSSSLLAGIKYLPFIRQK